MVYLEELATKKAIQVLEQQKVNQKLFRLDSLRLN